MQVVEVAANSGVRIEPVTFERETRTSKDAAREIGCEVAEIVKSLVFKEPGSNKPVLLLLSGADRVDLKQAAAALGVSELVRADADEARAATGYSIGATPPFGHESELPVAIDDRILDFESVWAAGGRTDTVFQISSSDLLATSGATLVRLREEAPN